MLGPVDARDVIYTKTRLRTPSTYQSSRRPPHPEWNQVIFRDESRFNLSSDDNRVRAWGLRGECLNPADTPLPQLDSVSQTVGRAPLGGASILKSRCSVSSLHQEAHCAPLRKEELILIAEELGEEITPEMRMIDLKNLILDSDKYKNNKEFIDDYLDSIISDRKSKEEQARVTAE
ncbi:hypothetical protein TNCV_161961 [Trichonephila clavipes]|nr:hypothetical protein TNCV_161961 [Trichonephila clavipes]